MMLTGNRSELLYKLPSLLAALAMLWLVYDLAARTAGTPVARVAGLLLVTSPLFTKLMYFARTDMMLALFIVVQIRAGYRMRPRIYWTAAALAFTTKGPLGMALPMVALSVWWWHTGELRERWKRLHIGTGLVLALVPFAVWFAAALVMEGQTVWNQLVRAETIDRFAANSTQSKEHRHILFYVPHLLARMAPASLFSLLALAALPWRRPSRDAMMLPVLWMVSMLALLSLVPSKRVDRLFPLVPAVCLLAAWAIAHKVKGISALLKFLAVTVIGAGLTLAWHSMPAAGIAIAVVGAMMFLPRQAVQIAALVLAMIAGTGVYHFRFRPDLFSALPGVQRMRVNDGSLDASG